MINNWTQRAIECLLPGIWQFQSYQSGIAAITDVNIKSGDQSLATIVDHTVEQVVLQQLAAVIPEVAVFSEEGGENAGSGEYYMYLDPVDGTREMTTETALSVMILGLMKRAKEGLVSRDDLLVGTIIAEPSTGRIWAAIQGEGCYKFVEDQEGGVDALGSCHVWEGPISTQTSILLDSSQGFVNTRATKRNPRQMLTDAQNARLYGLLNSKTHVRVLGPNGQIQALVANGGRGVAGSMSLALGWPWDACGALLVKEAGGSAIAISVIDKMLELEERDPLKPNSYDLLVCANNETNAVWLSRRLVEAYSA